MAYASEPEVDEWLRRAPDKRDERRDLNRAQLESVRAHGYSLLAAGPEVLQRHQAALSEFELSDRLPRREREVLAVTSELADFFFTDLVPGERYSLANVVVLVATSDGLPPMALRITGLPRSVDSQQVETWIRALKRVASKALLVSGTGR
jgi:hypothetical protein